MKRHDISRYLRILTLAAVLTGMSGVCALADTGSQAAGAAQTVPGTENAQAAGQEEAVPVQPAPTEFAHIYTCVIEGGDRITIQGQMEGVWSDPAFYDNYLYLFELQPYQDGLAGRQDYCGRIAKGEPLAFSVPLNLGTEQDRLYSRFVVAVFDGEKYTQVSNTAYVDNPEVLAKHTEPYQWQANKKGLLIQNTDNMVADAFELRVSHVIVNIPFQQILGQGIDYVYDGRHYSFNQELMETLDYTIRRFSEKSMIVTAVILNGWNDATPQLIYPGVTRQPADQVFYYGFNASTKEGVETIKAIASFLAERYSSLASPYGKVSNWVIGNEINNQQWNYMGPMDMDSYLREYERAFRVFYTAIRSTNQNDRLFFSTDFNWNHEANGRTKYNAREVIDRFAEITGAGSHMDWGLAYHPYPIPLVEPEFWDDDQTGLLSNDDSSPVVNLKNLSVLTDHMQRASLRCADGSVRHIILSEQGFTSTSLSRGENQDLQAAAIAYAYYIADSNPYIDAFIMSRQVDAPSEAAASQTFGLWQCDMGKPDDIVPTMPKRSWAVYKYIDNKNKTLETTAFAKAIIGIEKWSDVIPNFRWRNQEK